MKIGNQGKYKSGEKALTKSEYDQLIRVIGNTEHELLIKLAVSTGMRRDDITEIEIKNINWNEKKIAFYEKKKKQIHEVYIGENLLLLIEKHLNTIPKQQKKLFSFGGRQAYNILNKYCEKAGLSKRPFHSLRATCIKFCQVAGWTPEQTAKHVNDKIATIQEHYTVPSEGEMREIAQKKELV